MAEKVQPDSTMFFNKAAAGRPLFIEEQPKSNLITLASFDEDYRCSAAMDSSGGVCQRKAIKVSPSYTEEVWDGDAYCDLHLSTGEAEHA